MAEFIELLLSFREENILITMINVVLLLLAVLGSVVLVRSFKHWNRNG